MKPSTEQVRAASSRPPRRAGAARTIALAALLAGCAPVTPVAAPGLLGEPSIAAGAAPGPRLELDADRDGVVDRGDGCPGQAEDPDGFADEDGCPDPDNDLDSIVDSDDLCPDDPETDDVLAESDGCPDVGQLAVLAPDTSVVRFRTGRAELDAAARTVLDAAAAVLAAHPEILMLEIGGHADPRERKAGLDQARAQMALRYLVDRGVDAQRLTVRAYAASAPRTPPAVNARVELAVRLAVRPEPSP